MRQIIRTGFSFLFLSLIIFWTIASVPNPVRLLPVDDKGSGKHFHCAAVTITITYKQAIFLGHAFMSAALLRIVGWSYLPDFATKQALRVIHQIFFSVFHRAPPDPRTPAYLLHYRLTFAAVVLCYLVYNFLDASGSIPNNFYQLLGVYPDSNDTTLKMAFRGFARKYHPDRVGPSGESLFIEVRDAFEALKDPVVRFAYDRFGPDVLKWKECATMREYLRRGLLTSSFYHIMTGAGLILFSIIGRPSPIAAWRYLLFLGLFASELYLLLAPSPSTLPPSPFVDASSSRATVLDVLFPRWTVYQHILLLHQAFFFLSIALSRVAPVLFPSLTRGDPAVDERIVRAMGGRLDALARTTERELSIMLDMEIHSIHETPIVASQTSGLRSPEIVKGDTMRVLAKEMEDVIVEDMLKSEVGPVKTAWDAVIDNERRKRAGAEARRLREVADKHPSPLPGTCQMKTHNRARSLSM